jgi:hypothetical protein
LFGEEEPGFVFDAGRIIDHYREFRDTQHQQLASTNISDDFKRLLFGFSESHYLPRNEESHELIIQNHPLKGRILMSKLKYERL